MSIAFSGQVTWPLFRRAQIVHLGWRVAFLLLFPQGALLAIIWAAAGEMTVLEALAGVGAAFLFSVGLAAAQVWQWRQLFRRSPYLRNVMSGTVSDDGIEARSALGESRLPWHMVIKCKTREDFALLYQSPAMFIPLSRSFFRDENDWDAAVQLLRGRCGRLTMR